MPKTILMLATFGIELVEVGGTLALHAQAGDHVHAAVLLSRPEYRPEVQQAAQVLGIKSVRFLDFNYGEVMPDPPSKVRLVRLLREVRPEIVITQDPEHVTHDLDPDRRLAMLLYLESLAVAGRDWRIEECGGLAPTPIPAIYYMWAERPNCVVDIGATFQSKARALAGMPRQLVFIARAMRARMGDPVLHAVMTNYAADTDDAALGLALHQEIDKANAMYHGILSHSGAGLAEAFRHEGPLLLSKLS
jgi:LmbE family N-acetylglucosaminyl deacetylase